MNYKIWGKFPSRSTSDILKEFSEQRIRRALSQDQESIRQKRKIERTLTGLKGGWSSEDSVALDNFMSLWCDRLGTQVYDLEVDRNTVIFHTEILSIRLRGMGLIPVLLVGGELFNRMDGIHQFKRDYWSGEQVPLALFATDAGFAHASTVLPSSGGVMVTCQEILSLLLDDDPIHQLRLKIRRQLPFRRLIPFTFTQPIDGPMFVGRKNELEMLLHKSQVVYALNGSGYVGKTSLMRQVQWTLRRQLHPRYQRTVEVDLYTCPADSDGAAKQIAQRIQHTSFSNVLTVRELIPFLRRMRHTDNRFQDGPIELFIDEVDAVWASDKAVGYPLLKTLMQAQRDELIRLVFCGRKSPKEVWGDSNNPFHERIHLINLGPLSWEEGQDLLTTPLDDLGVQFTNRDEILDRVLKMCQRLPLKLQRWGFEIANRAVKNPNHRFSMQDFYDLEREIAA